MKHPVKKNNEKIPQHSKFQNKSLYLYKIIKTKTKKNKQEMKHPIKKIMRKYHSTLNFKIGPYIHIKLLNTKYLNLFALMES